MSVTIRWYDDKKTILLTEYSGRWTLEEYHRMIDAAVELNQGIPHTVHRIVDFTTAENTLPRNWLGGLRSNQRRIPNNIGCVVLVGAGTMMRTFTKIAEKLGYTGKSDLRFAETVMQAEQLIRSQCDGIPPGDGVDTAEKGGSVLETL